MITSVSPGDVLAVNTGNAFTSTMIRVGEALEGQPGVANHVLVAHHADKRGTWWAIEGRPGGVGWADMTPYLLDGVHGRYANSNHEQIRAPEQNTAIAELMVTMLNTGYDWMGGIAADGAAMLHLPALAKALDDWWGWQDPRNPHARPGHVVCSSVAAWAYRSLGLPCPAGDAERVTPAGWWEWNANLAIT